MNTGPAGSGAAAPGHNTGHAASGWPGGCPFSSPERGFLLPLHVMVAHPGSQGALPARSELEEGGKAEPWLSRDAQLQNESAASGTAWPRSSLIPTSKRAPDTPLPPRLPDGDGTRNPGSHVSVPSGPANRPGSIPTPAGGWGAAIGGVVPGTCQLGDARGAPGSLLAAAAGRALKGRKQVGRKGGVPPAARTPRSPPPTGRKRLLVEGWGSGRAQGGSLGRFRGGGGSRTRRRRQGHTSTCTPG